MNDWYASRLIPRILGAAVLLALAVLLVPDVYGQRSHADSVRAADRGRVAEQGRTAARGSTAGRSTRARSAAREERSERASTRQRTPVDRQDAASDGVRIDPRAQRVERAAPAGRDRRSASPPLASPGRRDRSDRYEAPRYARPTPSPARPPAHRSAAPRVVVDVRWPWEHRYRTRWSPRYRYRQHVHVRAGRGAFRRTQELEVVTTYRQRVRSASRGRADVEVDVERLELYRNGRFVGEVHHLPRHLRRITARIYRSDRVRFDRDLFLVGTPRRGFELIATRHYDGHVLSAYERGHDVEAGALDFRSGRVVPVRYSRLFDPYGRSPLVPTPLIPDDPALLLDYAGRLHSAPHYHDRPKDRRYDDRDYHAPYADRHGDSDIDVYFRKGGTPGGAPGYESEVRTREQHLRTHQGGEMLLKREMQLERIE